MKPRPSFLALTVFCSIAALVNPAPAAAPANDNFADAEVMTGAPIDITANNTDATSEAEETDPGDYGGASVWYSWTAPSTGWFTIHTSSTVPGSGLDTVLALFADGASVSAAAMLGHNDDSVRRPDDFPLSVYPDGYGPSRLVFHATFGTVYKIAVHGFGGAAGPFELHLAAEPMPEFVVSAVTFSPPTVDASTTPSSIATVAIQTAEAFTYANFSLLRSANGREATNDFIDVGDFVAGSGDPTNGSYTAEVSIGEFEQPGNWPAKISQYSQVLDDYLEWTSSGDDVVEDDYLIPQSNAFLEVENSGSIDSTAPEITAFAGLPATIDLSSGDASFDIVLDATDDLSGVEFGNILFYDGVSTSYSAAYFDVSSNTGGDTYTIPIYISADYPFVPPGTYQVELEIQDFTGNLRRYGPTGQALPGNPNTSVSISITPPANDDFGQRSDLGSALPATASGTTRFATIESGESNLNASTAATVWYEWTAPSTGWVSVSANNDIIYNPIVAVCSGTDVATLQELGRNNGSITGGLGVGPKPLVFQAEAGTSYQIAVCGDGNTYGQTGEFELEIAEASPPAIHVTGFSLTPAVVDVGSGSQVVTFEFTVESAVDLFPSSFVQAFLTPTASNNSSAAISAFISVSDRISGTNLAGTYRDTFTLPGYYEPSQWNLVIEAFSPSGELFRWTPRGSNNIQDAHLMAQSGGFVDVQNSGAVDVNPPVVVSVTGLPAAADVSSPVPVTLTITATDDASGIQSGSIYLTTNSQSSSTSYGIATFTSANLVAGSTMVYEVEFDLTDFIQPGDYELEMTLTDFTGKVRYYDTLHEDLPAGSTGTVTINLGGGGYPAWAATQDFGPGGLDGELDDPNSDGINNLLCYAFNLTPLAQATRVTPGAGDTAGLPAISVIGAGPSRRLRIEYLQRIGASSGLTYRAQFGASLSSTGPGAWQDAAATPPVPIDTDWERIVIEDPVQGAPSRFGRVLIEHAAP